MTMSGDPAPGQGRSLRSLLLLFMLALAAVLSLQPFRCRLESAPGSTAVYDHRGRLLRLSLAADGRYRIIAPLASYPQPFVEAVLLKEDRWFRLHRGVNPYSLARAVFHSWVVGDYRSGASTITMQTARLAGGYDSASPSGKLRQIVDALLLELVYTKTEILEAYLSRVPCGGNIEGFQTASLAYFAAGLDSLPLPESLLLISLPQRPGSFADEGTRSELLASRSRLFAQWKRNHRVDASVEAKFALPVDLKVRLPFETPHAVDSILAGTSGSPQPRLDTTIDLDLQKVAGRVIRSYVGRRRSEGIRNASTLLVDSRTMEVLVEIGSADFFDASIEGQVNGTEARRSPGSTLKPFLYGLAFQEGVIHPATVLKDAPINYSGYNPDNFDNDFEGPIPAREALIRSRNVPAVWLSQQVHDPDFLDFLVGAGISGLKGKDWYGASLILGTAELSLKELSVLYASLARGGKVAPLRRRLDEPIVEGKQILSPEAAWMVLDILNEKPRPESAESAFPDSKRIRCAWKTGTSIGFRDAWAFGVSGPYVLAVWIGNFDGSSNPAFVGLSAAGPLLFELLEAFSFEGLKLGREGPGPAPFGISMARVCAASGKIPTELCARTVETPFIRGVSPIDRCDVHQAVFIDNSSGLRVRDYLEGKTRREVYEIWPSDLMAIFAKAGLPRRTPPPFAKASASEGSVDSGARPLISSPLNGGEYILGEEGEEMPFVCSIPSDSSKLFWFLDGSIIGTTARGGNLYWKPRPGEFVLRVADEHGRSSSSKFRMVR